MDNLDQEDFQATANQSLKLGVASLGIGDSGKSHVIGFDEAGIKKHLNKWMEGPKENNSFKGIQDLERAVDDGLLRPGQPIFGAVSIKHHESAEGFHGWIYDCFSSLITLITKKHIKDLSTFWMFSFLMIKKQTLFLK